MATCGVVLQSVLLSGVVLSGVASSTGYLCGGSVA